MEYINLVTQMSESRFAEVVDAAPRRIRETLFGRLGIKAKKSIGLKLRGKREERTRKLHVRLKDGSTKAENDLCEELLRNWLYTQRPLLKDTLDYLEVANDDGLIEEEPTFFQELEEDKVKALVDHLKGKDHEDEAIYLYLGFMAVPHLDKVASAA